MRKRELEQLLLKAVADALGVAPEDKQEGRAARREMQPARGGDHRAAA